MKNAKNFAWVAIIATALFALSVTGCPGNDDPGSNNGDQNQAPTANAGTNFEHNITTSGTTITLNGSGTDADGTVEGYAWTCTDKPATATAPTFSNSAIHNPTVSGFDTLGDYEFSLKVKDNENKESTADVVKVSLCMTATKNVTTSFTEFVAGETIDFKPTYAPENETWGTHFQESDITYTLSDGTTTWNSADGFNGIVNSELYDQIISFTQFFYYKGEEVANHTVKVVASFGWFDWLTDGTGVSIDSDIPSIDITLSKKVSAGAIPQYETVTATITVPAITFTPGDLIIDFGEVSDFEGWDSNFPSTDVTYTLKFGDENLPEGTTSIKATDFSDGVVIPLIQTFYYDGKSIDSRSVRVTVSAGIFTVMAHITESEPVEKIEALTLHLSKQVEKE